MATTLRYLSRLTDRARCGQESLDDVICCCEYLSCSIDDHSTSKHLKVLWFASKLQMSCQIQNYHISPNVNLINSPYSVLTYIDTTRASIYLGHCEQIFLDAVQIRYVTGSRFSWTSINLAPAGKVALLSLPL